MAQGPMIDSPFRPNAEQLRAVGDLRDLVRAECNACTYAWSAPVVVRCPRCHSASIVIFDRAMIGARRI